VYPWATQNPSHSDVRARVRASLPAVAPRARARAGGPALQPDARSELLLDALSAPHPSAIHVKHRSLSPIAAATAAPITMREGTTTMNRTSVTLTLLALGLLLLLALISG
jgi:hypothetical protein